MRLSLKMLVLSAALITLFIAIGAFIAVYHTFDERTNASLQLEARKKTKIVADLISSPMQVADYNDVVNVISHLIQDENVSSVKVVNQFGDIIIDHMKAQSDQSFKASEEIEGDSSDVLGKITIGFRFLYVEKAAAEFKAKILAILVSVVGLIALMSLLFIRYFQSFFRELKEGFIKLTQGKQFFLNTDSLISDVVTISESFNETSRKIEEMQDLAVERAKLDATAKIAAQVAHDIRSPLTVFNMLERDLNELPENKRLIIRASINRIRDIANDLLERNRVGQFFVSKPTSAQLLSDLIEPLISEKCIQFSQQTGIQIELHLDPSCYGLFANVQPIEFKRIISNLLNNSVEAIGDTGKVGVYLHSVDGKIEIRVEDNGKGIPPHIISQLGQRGVTFGKENGSGLGLFYARTTIESWGGSLSIRSKVNNGTTVILGLPKAKTPAWFVEKLVLKPQSSIVILDDDDLIHQIWKKRFEHMGIESKKVHRFDFYNSDQLRKWVKTNSKETEQSLFLLDYELIGDSVSGLDLCSELGIGLRSVLVTGSSDDINIRQRCEEMRVPLVPKGLANFVPIELGADSMVSATR